MPHRCDQTDHSSVFQIPHDPEGVFFVEAAREVAGLRHGLQAGDRRRGRRPRRERGLREGVVVEEGHLGESGDHLAQRATRTVSGSAATLAIILQSFVFATCFWMHTIIEDVDQLFIT